MKYNDDIRGKPAENNRHPNKNQSLCSLCFCFFLISLSYKTLNNKENQQKKNRTYLKALSETTISHKHFSRGSEREIVPEQL